MKHLFKSLLLALALTTGFSVNANAQFGKFLKKVAKVLETPTTTTQSMSSSSTSESTSSAAFVPITSGGSMQNTAAEFVDVELVGVYGTSTSANYGTVEAVLKMRMKLNKTSIGLGGEVSIGAQIIKTVAFDEDGNNYKTDSGIFGGQSHDVTEGMFVKVILNGTPEKFLDVKKSAKKFQIMKIAVFIDATHRGVLTFKDVPVQWDVQH